jgi:hypothetical protein
MTQYGKRLGEPHLGHTGDNRSSVFKFHRPYDTRYAISPFSFLFLAIQEHYLHADGGTRCKYNIDCLAIKILMCLLTCK